MILFNQDHRINKRLHWLYMRRLRAQETSHPIGAWPRQPAYFEPPPTSGSLQLLRVPMGRNHLDAETQSHLIFSPAGDVCPWRPLPQPGLGPERLVCLFNCGASQKIDPVVTAGETTGGWIGEKKCADVVYTQCGRPRHLCLISDERVQVRCRRKHRTFRLGKPVAAAVEARVA